MAVHLNDPGDQVWFIPTLIASEQSAQIFKILLFCFSQRGLVIIVHLANSASLRTPLLIKSEF